MKWSFNGQVFRYACGKCKLVFDDEVLCRVHEERCTGVLQLTVLSKTFKSRRQAYEALNRLRRVVSNRLVRELQVRYDVFDNKYRLVRR